MENPQPLVQKFANRVTNIFIGDKDELYPQVLENLAFLSKLSYWFCATPFCIQKDPNGTFKIHTNKCQQMVTALLNILVLMYIVRTESLIITKDREQSLIKNPRQLFFVLSAFSRISFITCTFYVFWLRKNVLQKLILFETGEDKGYTKIGSRCRVIKTIICLWILSTLGSNIYLRVVLSADSYYSQFYVIPFLNLDYNKYLTSTYHFQTQIVIAEVFLGILTFYTSLVEDISVLFILSSAFMVYQCCRGFYNRLVSQIGHIKEVLEHYGSIRFKIEIINDFVSLLLFVYVIELSFRTLHVPFAFATDGLDYYILFFIARSFAILFMAAEANAKICYLKKWLFSYKFQELSSDSGVENKRSNCIDSYKLLKWDCCSTELGLACKVFTVTYASIGLLLSLLGTFGIVQLQFYNAANQTAINGSFPRIFRDEI